MDEHLLAGIFRWNPWLETPAAWPGAVERRLPRPFVPRRVAPALEAVGGQRAALVIGPRQAGKSTLIWDAVRSRHRSCLYVHAEDPLIAGWCASASSFLADFDRLPGPPEALFLDEAQRLENAALFVKGLVDIGFGRPIYVTGSSSFHLGDRIRESLAGRATRVRLLPFSLDELLAYEGVPAGDVRALVVGRRIWERQMLFGGFPDIYLHGDEQQRLFDLVESFVLRDASDRHRIRHPAALRKLLQLMAGQVGNLVRQSEWAAICQIAASTVADYAGILEESHVVRLLPVFAGGRRAELTSSPKVYFIDNGVRNLLARDFSPIATRADRGALFENWVCGELLKSLLDPAELHHWRTRSGAEVDFVLFRPGAAPVAVEAKLDGRPPRLSRGARSFIEAYRPQRFITVTAGAGGEAEILGADCVWCRPHELTGALPASFLRLS